MQYLIIALLYAAVSLTLLACSEEETECAGQENPDCICTDQYDPVCGCNNITYSNACRAECAGINSYVAGTCEDR